MEGFQTKRAVKPTYVTISNFEFYDCLKEDADQGETNWTISRNARVGNRILLYICAPVSAVVAVATLATTPERNDDPSSEWFRHYMADMCGLRMLAEPITRAMLLDQFPGWRYWKQPRNSALVPAQFLEPLEQLLSGR